MHESYSHAVRRPMWRRRATARLALMLPVVMCGCGAGEPDYRTLHSFAMESGTLEVEWAPARSDDPAYVRLRKIDRRSDEVLYEGRISNNGEKITLDNIRPDVSNPPTMHLCLNGGAQNDLYVRVDMTSTMVVEVERECSE